MSLKSGADSSHLGTLSEKGRVDELPRVYRGGCGGVYIQEHASVWVCAYLALREASAFLRVTKHKTCPLQHACLFSRSAEMRHKRDFRTPTKLSR